MKAKGRAWEKIKKGIYEFYIEHKGEKDCLIRVQRLVQSFEEGFEDVFDINGTLYLMEEGENGRYDGGKVFDKIEWDRMWDKDDVDDEDDAIDPTDFEWSSSREDVFADFLSGGELPFVKEINAKKSFSVKGKGNYAANIFPANVFRRRGARVSELGGGRWLVDFVSGRYVSSPVDERYIHKVLNDCNSDLVDQGIMAWAVEEVQNGKFIIRRVA